MKPVTSLTKMGCSNAQGSWISDGMVCPDGGRFAVTSLRMPVIKELFARASHCAYPGCKEELVFEDEGRGVRAIAVQIAHIRSAKPGGPRHDPEFPDDHVNDADNLLLLCGKHHPVVDQNESVYTIDELLEWKADQSSSGSTAVSDDELVSHFTALRAGLDAVLGMLGPDISVGIVGRQRVGDGLLRIPLATLGSLRGYGEELRKQFVAVEVINRSIVATDIVAAGLEVGLEGCDVPGRWQFAGGGLNLPFPHRLGARSTQWWNVDAAVAQRILTMRSFPARQVRAYADLGDGDKVVGSWVDINCLEGDGERYT